MSSTGEPTRLRREPPRFRAVTVRRRQPLSPRMVRVTLTGPDLDGFDVDLPGASVRLLLPDPGTGELVTPRWNGNEFLLPDGTRPIIRTMTPRRVDPEALELDVDVVLHAHGPAPVWASTAAPGAPAAVSGPGRGYAVDAGAPAFLLAGDEAALPAICQLLEALPTTTPAHVIVEITDPSARLPLPLHEHARVTWVDAAPSAAPGTALVRAVQEHRLAPGTKVWAAGEAAAMQRIRTSLFEDRGLPRADATVRGYWKVGRGGDAPT